WVLAKHRSSFSTMEGNDHLRALGEIGSRVMTFCGAGRVARFLDWTHRFAEPEEEGGDGWIAPENRGPATTPFTIFGLGAWAEADEASLHKMSHPRYTDGINPFTLTRVKARPIPYEKLDGLYLQTLARAYPDRSEPVGTTRVYRLVHHEGDAPGRIVLARRVVFELRYGAADRDGARRYDPEPLR